MRIFEPVLSHPEELLSGEHTRTIQITAPSTGIMSKFAVKKETCYGCKSVLSGSDTILCGFCRPRAAEFYLSALSKNNELERLYSQLWTQCQRCQGSLLQEVICNNFDCPIFYMRKKVQKEVVIANTVVQKFFNKDLLNK
jgi:DNA polymerase delta subunit 1